ncbi:magnesium-dependent phosphatase 1-like [Halichondria panicea]|uniref:magnesium-dependent phosphatase 1-like n=1 Tax=Halichondria panicea TaxID=6063 RepID=UPI00312BC7EC
MSSTRAECEGDGLSEFMQSMKVLPKMVVLNLDYTVWELHVDMTIQPFRSDKKGGAVDWHGHKLALFPDVRTIMTALQEKGIKLAAASSTTDPQTSRQLMAVLKIDKFFSHFQIFPTKKFKHFKNIQSASGVEYKDMLFFDNMEDNISDITTLGVTCFYIEDQAGGLTMDRFKTGLEQFSHKHSQ